MNKNREDDPDRPKPPHVEAEGETTEFPAQFVPPPESPEHRYFFEPPPSPPKPKQAAHSWDEVTPPPSDLAESTTNRTSADDVFIIAPETAEISVLRPGAKPGKQDVADSPWNTSPQDVLRESESTAEFIPVYGEGRILRESESTAEFIPVHIVSPTIVKEGVPVVTPGNFEPNTPVFPDPDGKTREVDAEPGIPFHLQLDLGLHEPMVPGSSPEEMADTTPLSPKPVAPQSQLHAHARAHEDSGVAFSVNTESPPATQADRSEANQDEDEDDDDDDAEQAPPGFLTRLPMILLVNYASIVTLLCAYLWVNGGSYRGSGAEALPVLQADQELDGGSLADAAFAITPPQPLPASAVTTLGKSLKAGGLQWTPLRIKSDDVVLESILGVSFAKPMDGGKDALWLLCEVKNTSSDSVFSPLDPSFVRRRERTLPDSFIETPDQRIYQYPLSENSDQKIRSQEFPELKPGEVAEFWLVSDKNALKRVPDTDVLTWRVRLRVGPEATKTLGVGFRKKDIQSR